MENTPNPEEQLIASLKEQNAQLIPAVRLMVLKNQALQEEVSQLTSRVAKQAHMLKHYEAGCAVLVAQQGELHLENQRLKNELCLLNPSKIASG